MQDKSIGRHLPSVAFSKENSGSYWPSAGELNFRYKEHSLSSCFGKQESLLTELITS